MKIFERMSDIVKGLVRDFGNVKKIQRWVAEKMWIYKDVKLKSLL